MGHQAPRACAWSGERCAGAMRVNSAGGCRSGGAARGVKPLRLYCPQCQGTAPPPSAAPPPVSRSLFSERETKAQFWAGHERGMCSKDEGAAVDGARS